MEMVPRQIHLSTEQDRGKFAPFRDGFGAGGLQSVLKQMPLWNALILAYRLRTRVSRRSKHNCNRYTNSLLLSLHRHSRPVSTKGGLSTLDIDLRSWLLYRGGLLASADARRE